jgi:hypothetical protein
MKRFLWVAFWLVLYGSALAVAPTKTRTSFWSAQTLTAGAGNTTSSAVNMDTAFECQINIKLTNGGTGPTVPAQVQVQVANNTTPTLLINYGGPLVGTSVNSDISYFSVTLPIGLAQSKLVAGSNTGQNVTVDADISCVTGIAAIDTPMQVAAR